MIDLRPYETEEAILKIFHPRHIHRKIRKAQESGLTVRKGSSARDFEQFHALQVQTRHRQGSPTFPKSMFQHVFEEMHESNLAHLYLVCQNELVISGTIFFHFGDTATYAYGASLSNRDYWQLGVNQLAMWHGIRDAFRTGKARIDLGTTPIHQHGLRTYKERWGGETELYQFSYGAERPEDLQIVRTAGSARVASWILARIPERLFERISSRLMRAVT
jgi:lipid II:glycine glycyltransferase (peptidoglycan interpeptide bridge formation enzyme)